MCVTEVLAAVAGIDPLVVPAAAAAVVTFAVVVVLRWLAEKQVCPLVNS